MREKVSSTSILLSSAPVAITVIAEAAFTTSAICTFTIFTTAASNASNASNAIINAITLMYWTVVHLIDGPTTFMLLSYSWGAGY